MLGAVLTLLGVVGFLLYQNFRPEPMSCFSIPNSSLGLIVTKNSDGRLFCQLYENGHPISELHPLTSAIPLRHYKWFVDEKTICASNIVTISWMAEDGWDGDHYRVTIDANARQLLICSNVVESR